MINQLLGCAKLPNPYTPSIQQAVYKQTAHDFIVHELQQIDFCQHGEHLWLHIEKVNLNTHFVAKLLAKWADIPIKDVGFSGLKDRHALTTQYFSLRLPKKVLPAISFPEFLQQNPLNFNEKLTILTQHWHNKKLQRGTHKFNQFIITLKNVVGDKRAIEQQLHLIKKQGVPNYFGEQRFGQNEDNLHQAVALFQQRLNLNPRKAKDKERISLYLSSARSELFNAILAKRVLDSSWQTPILGDVMNLSGSQSIFVPSEIDDTICHRLDTADIHLTGAMWGAGELQSFAEVAKLELFVINNNPTYQLFAQGLADFGLKQQRRALRLLAKDFTWQWLDENSLQLAFCLPAGCFATTILACLLQ